MNFNRSYTCPHCGQTVPTPGGHPGPAECIKALKYALESNQARLLDYKSILELQGVTMRDLSAKVELLTLENARLSRGLGVYRDAAQAQAQAQGVRR